MPIKRASADKPICDETMMKKQILKAISLVIVLICLDSNSKAQGIDVLPGDGSPTGGTIIISSSGGGSGSNGTFYADSISIYPEIEDVADLFVTPGSSVVLDLTLQTTSELPAVHSFSVSFANEPDLTLSIVDSSLPPGWTSSPTTNSFSGLDVSGQDINSPTVVLAKLTYSVASDAPIGSVLALPDPANFGFFDANENSINTWGIFIIPGYGATVVEAPEPSSGAFVLTGILLLVVLRASGWIETVRERRTLQPPSGF